MAAPTPKTIGEDLRALLIPHLESGGRMLDPGDPLIVELLDGCNRLQKVDAIDASVLKAEVYHSCGDIASAEYWARNAALNGGRLPASQVLAVCYSNLGFVTKAAEKFTECTEMDLGFISQHPHLGMSCGAPSVVIAAADRFVGAGGDLSNDPWPTLAAASAAALSANGISEADLRAMMSEAGELLRARRLLWMFRTPEFHVVPGKPSLGLAVSYRIAVSPDEAAELTWALAESLATKNLMKDGVTVAFIGQALVEAA